MTDTEGARTYATFVSRRIPHHIGRLEEKYERIMECNTEIKQDGKWIIWHLKIDSDGL